jgi:cob(I)alamin adenosyltransferase
MEKAYVQIYTGEGKGKTTAALGLALRALGAGLSVFLGQFIKGMRYSEIEALDRLSKAFPRKDGSPALEVRQFGRGCFIRRAPESADIEAAASGLAAAREAMLSGKWDLVILDEINVALSIGLLSEADVLGFLDERPETVELVLTGRGAPASLIERADLVTEMREVKHYYKQGVEARKGIES